ncbi:MAG: type II toxin-antitoxin system RelE/ParE family toxin [Cycloclasticus pugetii]|jgi:proteic killer suppression protein|uniref:type II toxin-antitoxin system RelE/ParE family toxin n=1 Tax=Cycloclasticus pugetii TaxID=34068 RepID=UPI003A8EA7B7
MIKSYANKLTEKVAVGEFSKKLPINIKTRALMRLVQLDNAYELDDLKLPSSNQLEKLSGDRKGQYSIRINQQWRLCFEFKSGDAFNVEITDYH